MFCHNLEILPNSFFRTRFVRFWQSLFCIESVNCRPMNRRLGQIEGVLPAGIAFPAPQRLGGGVDPNSGFRRVFEAATGGETAIQAGFRGAAGAVLCPTNAAILLGEQERRS